MDSGFGLREVFALNHSASRPLTFHRASGARARPGSSPAWASKDKVKDEQLLIAVSTAEAAERSNKH